MIGCALATLLLSAGAISAQPQTEQPARPLVLVATLEDQAISPGTTRYLDRALAVSDQRNAECLVIVLDTPGGLLDSTRHLVKEILRSGTPVVVYVAPQGGRAASAGVFVTMAAHVAAMAPGTTIGAAHPVALGGLPAGPQTTDEDAERGGPSAMEQKLVNDTVAWARALAAQRQRNEEWAAKAVSESVSVSASKALDEQVIDLVADDLDQLLAEIDGRSVELPTGVVTLDTSEADVQMLDMWWGEQLLAVLAHPNVAFLLLMFGFYGLLFELYSPGWGVGGTLGIVCLLLGLFGLAVLPVNYLGLALLLIAFGLMVAEILVTSYGALGAAGTVCLILGAVTLVDSPAGFLRVSWTVVLPVAAATALILLILASGVLRTHRGSVQTGGEGLIGAEGRVAGDFALQQEQFRGQVRLHGERWRAVSGCPLAAEQPCRVIGREGLMLVVEPLEDAPDEKQSL